MRIDGSTISEMFEVLRDKIVFAGSVIKFKNINDIVLCQIPFTDIVEDTSVPGEFYFQDQFGSKIIRAVIATTGTPAIFEIYDSGSDLIISGSVSLLNAGGDITFNSTDWESDQIAILSSLKIVFPTEN